MSKGVAVSRDLPDLLRFADIFVARSAGLEPATFSVRIHSPSQTGRYSGGQGETNQRFYLGPTGLEGTGRDTERHPVAVRLQSKSVLGNATSLEA